MSEEKTLFLEEMKEAVGALEISLTELQLDQFYNFYVDLVETNKVMNLTAITERKAVICKHFVDSLALIKAVPDLGEKEYRIMDMGTGAGFPGIPLAIAWPNLNLVLADSLNKRIRFIENECEKLQIRNVTAVHGRAEDLARKNEFRESFDYCVSRAVANLSTLSEYCLPFIHIGGMFIPYKSGTVEEEIDNAKKAIKLLGGKYAGHLCFELPGEEGNRSLVKIEKIAHTMNKFPRKAGLPSKEPL